MKRIFSALVLSFSLLVLSACSGGGSSSSIDKIFGSGQTPILNSIPDQIVAQTDMISVDVNNILNGSPGSDENMSYSCFYDTEVSGSVTAGSPCSDLPGTKTFNSSKGELIWTPDTSVLGDYEFKIVGQSNAGTYEEVFSIGVRLKFFGIGNYTSISGTTVTMTWTPNLSAVAYQVFKLNATSGQYELFKTVNGASESGTVLTGLTPNTGYTFRVQALDVLGHLDGNVVSRSVTTTELVRLGMSAPVATIAAGSSVPVTIQAYNADGSPQTVGGLPIVVSVASGTSIGSFSGIVDNNNGTYTANYTPTIVGTPAVIEASINISYYLMNNLTMTIVPGAPVSANSTLSVSSNTVISGTNVSLSTTLRDAYSNLISDATVQFLKSGGTSTGNFSSVVNQGSGIYTTTYEGIVAGSAQTIRVEANGIILTPSVNVTVNPGPASSASSTLTISSSSISAGSLATVTATLRDANANLISSGVFVSFNKSGGTASGTLSAVSNLGSGQYSATYTGETAGTAQTLSVVVDGITLTPTVTVAVVPGAPSLANSLLSLTNNTVVSGQLVTVTATLKDAYNNVVPSGYTIDFTATGGSSTGTFSAVTNQGSGLYNVRYTGVVAGTAQTIRVRVNGTSLGLSENIVVVAGSPNPSHSSIVVSSSSIGAGQSTTVSATLRDLNENPISSGYAVTLTQSGGTSSGTLGSITNLSNGTYTASFTGTTAGSATTLQLVVDGIPLGPTVNVTVTAGAPDNTLSTFTATANAVTAGGTVQLSIHLKDAYGNSISSGYVVGVQNIGGTSSGNLSTVSNSGGGLYSASFQGTTVGSPLVLQATVNAGGIGPTRTIQVEVGAPHISHSSISISPSPVVAGSDAIVDAVVRDAYNNTINSEYTITFDATSGTSSGNLIDQSNPSSGIHRIKYHGVVAGTAQNIRVLADGAPIAGLTASLQVIAGAVSVENSSFSISATTVQSSTTANISMTLRDALSNPVNNATIGYQKSNGGSNGNISAAVFSSSGSYSSVYSATTKGSAQTINPIVNGTVISGLSISVTVIAGPPVALDFAGTTSGLNAIDCHGPFTVTLKDAEGNNTKSVSSLDIMLTAQNSGMFDSRLFSDSGCNSETDRLSYTTADETKTFYFKSFLPMTENLLVIPPGGITGVTKSFSVNPVISILGSSAIGSYSGASSQFVGADASSGLLDGFGSLVVGNNLYVADQTGNRILRFNHVTQTFTGWIGHIGDLSGISSPCSSQALNDLTSAWCTGGRSQTVTTPTIFRSPRGLASDGTYLYVSTGTHQILRFDISTGAYAGWIGRIGTTAATSPAACVSAGINSLTPTWCYGGTVTSSGVDGSFSSPSEMIVYQSKLYVVDTSNNRIQRWNVNGTYEGWVGKTLTAATSPTACVNAGVGAATPVWCMGGTPTSSTRRGLPAYNQAGAATPTEGLNSPVGITTDGTYLYVGDTGNRRILRINLSTGAYSGWIGRLYQGTGSTGIYPNSLGIDSANANIYPSAWIEGGATYESTSSTGFGMIYSLWYDSGVLYVADNSYNKIIKIDAADGQNYEWVGRINTSPSGGSTGCSATPSLSVTPGWCRGGSGNMRGNGNLSFNGLYGVAGNANSLFVVDRGNYRIQRINRGTGLFEGWIGTQISSQSNWRRSFTGVASTTGYDNYSFGDVGIAGSWNGIAISNTDLFVTDSGWHRIKKHNKETGAMSGYIGIIDGNVNSGSSTGGFAPTGPDACFGITTGMTPDWCMGGGRTTAGSGVHGYSSPRGVAATNDYIYITNLNNHRLDRVRISDALYMGWHGMVNTDPTDGEGNCVNTTTNGITPGWCIGGTAKGAGELGGYNGPRSIAYDSSENKLYVTDTGKVAKVDGTTGIMSGMIGHISTVGAGCSIVGQGASGWCGANAIAGTGSSYYGATSDATGIAVNSLYIFVTDTGTHRIHRFRKSTGAPEGFLAKMTNNTRIVTNASDACNGLTAGYPRVTPGWCTGQTTGVLNTTTGTEENAFNSPRGIWADETYIYVADTLNNRILRINATTGVAAGWKGYIASTAGMTDSDCLAAGAGAITPKWCSGGLAGPSMLLGGFTTPTAITGDQFYLYVADSKNNRLVTIPKN